MTDTIPDTILIVLSVNSGEAQYVPRTLQNSTSYIPLELPPNQRVNIIGWLTRLIQIHLRCGQDFNLLDRLPVTAYDSTLSVEKEKPRQSGVCASSAEITLSCAC